MPKFIPLRPSYTVRLPSQKESICLSVWENNKQAVTVLFYPGTVSSPYMYPVLLEELFRLGCNVVALHPLGHGDSPRTKKAFTFPDIIANGKSAEQWIRNSFSGPVVLSGHSQGGIACVAHALESSHIAAIFPINTLLPHREDAGSVTRLAPLLRYKNIFLQALRTAAKICPALPIPFWLYLSMQRIVRGAYRVRLGHMSKAQQRSTYPLTFISSLFHLDLQKAEQKGSITCPLFLYTAKNDALFPMKMMQETFDSIAAPQKKCIPLSGGGHLCALSEMYGTYIAAHMAATCASLGLPLYSTQRK